MSVGKSVIAAFTLKSGMEQAMARSCRLLWSATEQIMVLKKFLKIGGMVLSISQDTSWALDLEID